MRARAGLLLVLAIGCDLPPEPGAAEGPRVLASEPADGEEGVDRRAALRVFFDRPLYPRDIHRGHVLVESGVRGAYVLPRFDPVRLELSLELAADLDPDVVYRLRVEGMRDLDLHEMSEPFIATFTTGSTASAPPDPALPGWADVAPVLEAACTGEGCHGADAPALGLDLSSAEGVRRTAIGVAAEQSRVGVEGEQPWAADTLAGLARVDVFAGVGRPARSYLVYKVLGDPHVSGLRMPPPPAAPLPSADAELLSRWILAGAPTD